MVQPMVALAESHSQHSRRYRTHEPGQWALLALIMGTPLLIYNILLIERKRSLLFAAEPFLQGRLLTSLDKVVFLAVFSAATLLLIVTATRILCSLSGRALPGRSWPAIASLASVGIAYFAAVTTQFKALQYFRDALSISLITRMGGGDLRTAFTYISNEFAGLLPLILLWCLLMFAGGWILKRYGLRWLRSPAFINRSAPLASARALLLANTSMMLLPVLITSLFPGAAYALDISLAYTFYSLPGTYLTDLDRDGYGYLGTLRDFAPFDASRRPYALDVPANGIDEDGVGGDLPALTWQAATRPSWNAAALERKNVLLVVMDSARPDIVRLATARGPVMPRLRSLSGGDVTLVSHAGFTASSIIGLFAGTMTEQESGASLIDTFNTLGYRTAVFSGQNEGFGDIARHAGMTRASVFVDATGFPAEQRMYANASPAALGIPAPLVNRKFADWLQNLGKDAPFFAYLNWQEMHFPYYYHGAPRPLIDTPVQRGNIRSSNRQQVWQTYLNAARCLDDALGEIVALLQRAGRWNDTVLLVLGDHGEELFDHGYLGHGIHLSFEQYAPLCKLVNSRWTPPRDPIAISEVGNLMYNALLRPGNSPALFRREVLSHSGPVETPEEIGLLSAEGLIKYHFSRRAWSRQSGYGAAISPAQPSDRVIHLWESYRVIQAASLKKAL